MSKSMVHLNSSILCCIDTETTGLIAGVHDLVQVCFLALDSNIQPLKEINGSPILPFFINLKPIRPENADPALLKLTD